MVVNRMLVEIRTILIKRETELENLENSQPIHTGMEKNRREDKFDKEIRKDQPSKQMPELLSKTMEE